VFGNYLYLCTPRAL